MKDSLERFVELGGKLECMGNNTYLLFADKRMRIPSHYFTSTSVDEQEVLDYYLDMMPKIYDTGKVTYGVVGYPEDLDLLTTCGTFNTNDCISHEDMRHLFKVKEIKSDN